MSQTAIEEAWARIETLDSQMEHERSQQEELRRKVAASRERELDLFGLRSEWIALLNDAGENTFTPIQSGSAPTGSDNPHSGASITVTTP